MATDLTKLVSKSIGGVLYQTSEGSPDHISLKGSKYTDLNTGKTYANLDGISSWSSTQGITLSFSTLRTAIAGESSGTWQVRSLGAPCINKVVTVSINSNGNNQTGGARGIGTGVENKFLLNNNSATDIVVQADSNGDIEIFGDNSGLTFFLTGAFMLS
jgi:hypothetical protein